MWRDICIANRDALLQELKRYRQRARLASASCSTSGDGAGLEKLFAAARDARDKWIHSS